MEVCTEHLDTQLIEAKTAEELVEKINQWRLEHPNTTHVEMPIVSHEGKLRAFMSFFTTMHNGTYTERVEVKR